MQKIHSLEYHRTSLSLRPASHRSARAALRILHRNGIIWSESELFRRLAKEYLRCWRGNAGKSATARRYNKELPDTRYIVRPWYVDKVLYSVLWQRAVHSGESVSRILDFSLRCYLPRLLESMLRRPMPGSTRGKRNAAYWEQKYALRKHKRPDLFINYSCETETNQNGELVYRQLMTIIPKTNLSPADILHLMRYTA